MPDITMCYNQQCEMRNTCYRTMAVPSDWQSWAIFTPKAGDCEHYIEYVPHTRKADKAIDWQP